MKVRGESDQKSDAPRPVLGYAVEDPSPNVIVWCRLLAIVMLCVGVERFAALAGYIIFDQFNRSPRVWSETLISVAVCVDWPLMGWYLWSQAPKLAIRLTDDTAPRDPIQRENRIVPNQILTVAVLVVGLYQFNEALPWLASVVISHSGTVHNLGDLPWRDMTIPLVRLGLAALLIIGNRVTVKSLRRLSDGLGEQTIE
jgi:hypothetical protein